MKIHPFHQYKSISTPHFIENLTEHYIFHPQVRLVRYKEKVFIIRFYFLNNICPKKEKMHNLGGKDTRNLENPLQPLTLSVSLAAAGSEACLRPPTPSSPTLKEKNSHFDLKS